MELIAVGIIGFFAGGVVATFAVYLGVVVAVAKGLNW